MNIGIGNNPLDSIIVIKSRMYRCWVMTCFRYSRTATLGGLSDAFAIGNPRLCANSLNDEDSRHRRYSDADSMYRGRSSYEYWNRLLCVACPSSLSSTSPSTIMSGWINPMSGVICSGGRGCKSLLYVPQTKPEIRCTIDRTFSLPPWFHYL